jgi:post-segregation antitoxin (ccd killing protein)
MKTNPNKVSVCCYIDKDIYVFAKDAGINMSLFLNTKLRKMKAKLEDNQTV